MREITPEIKSKLSDFRRKYYTKYPLNILDRLEDEYRYGLKGKVYEQIFSVLGLLGEEEDPYYQFFKIIKKNFNLNQDILEIGCGAYPRLSQIIDNNQTTGTITCYDPYLVTTKLGNIKLYKNLFDMRDNSKKYNLIISTYACEATEIVVDASLQTKSDLFLVFCDCFDEKYREKIIKYTKDNLDETKELIIESFNNDSNKVIYTRKK